MELRSYNDLRIMLHTIPLDKIKKGNISIMRHNINPVYEDPQNSQGGAWTLKLGEDILANHWKYYVSRMIIEALLTDNAKRTKNGNQINGIVLCPRRGFSVIQIWTKGTSLDYEDFHHNQGITSSSILFRRHQN